MTDIEIARNAELKKIQEIASSIGIEEENLEPYGKYKAKISLEELEKLKDKKDGRLQQLIKNQYDLHLEKLAHLNLRMKEVFSKIDKEQNYGHYLILNHAIKREEEYTKWLSDSLENINK